MEWESTKGLSNFTNQLELVLAVLYTHRFYVNILTTKWFNNISTFTNVFPLQNIPAYRYPDGSIRNKPFPIKHIIMSGISIAVR